MQAYRFIQKESIEHLTHMVTNIIRSFANNKHKTLMTCIYDEMFQSYDIGMMSDPEYYMLDVLIAMCDQRLKYGQKNSIKNERSR